MSAGNYVADYKTKTITCETCNGEKEVPVDRDDMMLLLNGAGTSFSWRRKLVSHWKKTGRIPCQTCDGRGTWEAMLPASGGR